MHRTLVALALALAATCAVAGPTLSQDPLQRCAQKVLRGDFGPVPAWKLDIYKRVIERGTTVSGKARKTNFCRSCAGTNCCDGSRVRAGICAASRNIPTHSVVWVECVGLLLVTDTGGAVKVRNGRSADFDVWVPRCRGTSKSQHRNCWTTATGTVPFTHWAMIQRGDGNKRRNSYTQPRGPVEIGLSR